MLPHEVEEVKEVAEYYKMKYEITDPLVHETRMASRSPSERNEFIKRFEYLHNKYGPKEPNIIQKWWGMLGDLPRFQIIILIIFFVVIFILSIAEEVF